jgi:hypothetical protein
LITPRSVDEDKLANPRHPEPGQTGADHVVHSTEKVPGLKMRIIKKNEFCHHIFRDTLFSARNRERGHESLT